MSIFAVPSRAISQVDYQKLCDLFKHADNNFGTTGLTVQQACAGWIATQGFTKKHCDKSKVYNHVYAQLNAGMVAGRFERDGFGRGSIWSLILTPGERDKAEENLTDPQDAPAQPEA